MTDFTIHAGPLAITYANHSAHLERVGFPTALWDRRLDVWSDDDGVQRAIAGRLGWLSAVAFVRPHLPRIDGFARSVHTRGFTDIVLLGMGGSSLAPEVLRQVLGVRPGLPRFRMLDSVDPDAVRGAMAHAATSLFVLASKSGSTIEPNAAAAEAQRRVTAQGETAWGTRFVAITDAGTALHQRAVENQFREVFVNPSDIGGRYSALSFFGMVPAALMGADVAALLESATRMEQACRAPVAENPGCALGAFLVAGAQSGRDKLTLLLPEQLASFGLWVEQLIAESTGKLGVGVVPVTGETPSAHMGPDRIAVAIELDGQTPDPALLDQVRTAGVPQMTLRMPTLLDIGAEFLRWEIATAVAGLLLKVNPFDEPNVQQAKEATRILLDAYATQRQLPRASPHASLDRASLTLTNAAEDQLSGDPAAACLRLLRPGDYFALLAYLPPDDDDLGRALSDVRHAIAVATKRPTTFGYGPRYLHSTGQLHKGGANNGVFLLITADPSEDLEIPREQFSFGTLELAQALGDFQSLNQTGRRALHVHLPDRDPARLRRLAAALVTAAAQASGDPGPAYSA